MLYIVLSLDFGGWELPNSTGGAKKRSDVGGLR